MAGDWIKMRGNLWDDPRVARLCDITNQGEAAIIGGLYWLWATADQHSEDGVMPGLTLRAISRKTGINGFGEALVEIGWLADHPEGVRIVRFDEHNGASAKRRCSESRRKMSARDADKKQTKSGTGAEEKQQSSAPREREEKRSKPSTPQAASTAPTGVGPPQAKVAPLVIELAIELQKAGVACTASHPRIVEWAEKKITVQQALEALQVARMRKPEGEPISPNYLAPIIAEILNPKPPPEPPWWQSDQATMAKGAELGVKALPGEQMAQFRERIREAVRSRHQEAA